MISLRYLGINPPYKSLLVNKFRESKSRSKTRKRRFRDLDLELGLGLVLS